MVELSFLAAASGTPLTKKFTRSAGKLTKHSYPRISEFTSYEVKVNSLRSFHRQLIAHARKGHCLLKGTVKEPLTKQSRAGSTDPNAPTQWVCLDLDGLTYIKDVHSLLVALGLDSVDHIIQYSASMGVDPRKGLSAHVFMLLDEPVAPSALKTWLRAQNLIVPGLTMDLSLTRTGAALRWPLDISVCQNDKLIYIAPPQLGAGVKDTFKGARIRLVQRSRRQLSTHWLTEGIDTKEIDRRQQACLQDLRKDAGLPKRKLTTRVVHGVPVETNVTPVEVTGVKEERGFTYLNLNGGDSWAYFHPTHDARVLYNFKGEPNYLLRELLPNYYDQATSNAQAAAAHNQSDEEPKAAGEQPPKRDDVGRPIGKAYLAFLDRNSDRYFKGTYDYDTDSLDLQQTSNNTKLIHFLKQHGQPVNDFIPEWDYRFDFASDVIFDHDHRTVNMFQRSEYMRRPDLSARSVPPVIAKVLAHALGPDPAAMERFLNWFAFLLQRREPPRTAWVLHGTQGTGKGVLFNQVLAPILGRSYTATKSLAELEDSFNSYMQYCVLLLVDEVQISESRQQNRVMSRLKNLIVEPTISIRAMNTGHFMAKNHLSLIFASNKPDPIQIDPDDRRFNCGAYQPERLSITKREWEQIPNELSSFVGFLMKLKVKDDEARTPYINDARRHIQHLTRNSIDTVADAILSGDLQFFIDCLPTDIDPIELDTASTVKHQLFKKMLAGFVDGARRKKRVTLTRDNLFKLFDYTVGGMPESPIKFTSLLKHHGIHVTVLSVAGKSVRGINVEWKADKNLLDQWDQHYTDKPAPKLRRVK